MSQQTLNLDFHPAPSARVLRSFLESRDAIVEAVMGPFGSGKTVCALAKLLYLALEQKPSPRDGVRRTRFAIIRDTYPNLRTTTMPSWHFLVPQSVGDFSSERPMTHTLAFTHPQLGRIETEFQFIALGEHRVEDVMRGWEGSGAYINEADRVPPAVREYVQGRILRFPAAVDGGPTNPVVLMDFNAPDVDSYLYKLLVEEPEPGFRFFVQPSGFSPEAENLEFLVAGYYEIISKGQPDWWIQRFVRNEWGYSREGKPVYPEFSDRLNVASAPLEPIHGLPAILGLDAGRTPACLIGQEGPHGQLRVIEEIVGEGIGGRSFGDAINQILAGPRWAPVLRAGHDMRTGEPGARGWGDPAADYASDQGESTYLDIIRNETRIPWAPSPCKNDLTIRTEEVRQRLILPIDADQRALMISPECRTLRKGFNSGYRYRRMQVANERYEDKPDKNEFSHVHDALQYLCVGIGHRGAVRGRGRDRDRRIASWGSAVAHD